MNCSNSRCYTTYYNIALDLAFRFTGKMAGERTLLCVPLCLVITGDLMLHKLTYFGFVYNNYTDHNKYFAAYMHVYKAQARRLKYW